MNVYIAKREGLDDYIVGCVSEKFIEYNDAELGEIIGELSNMKTCRKMCNKKSKGSFLDNIKNRLYFPYSLITIEKQPLDLYKYKKEIVCQ